MLTPQNIFIVIPAFREATVIGSVVADVRNQYPHVVVVDDCSGDGTGDRAGKAGAAVLRHPINLGQGAALQTGIAYALAEGADAIVTFDADGQHQVDDIARLVAVQRETSADVVIGSRFLGHAEGIPRLRKAVLKLAVLFTRVTSGLRVTDAHNGLRLITRSAAERIHITQNRMAHASELTDQFGRLKLNVAEAPVTIKYTAYSMEKGQKLSNAVRILAELFAGKLAR